MERRLYRNEFRKQVGGVCAGLSDYFGMDVVFVRLFFVLACIFHGGGLLMYIILWIVLPKRPVPYVDPTVDYTVPPQNPGDQAAGNNPFGAPYQGNPYSSNPFPNQPFQNRPFPNQPYQPKQSAGSTFAIMAGIVLIVVGGIILLDNLNIWPDWEYWRMWPLVPISVGLVLMLSGNDKNKNKNHDWQQAQEVKPEEPKTEDIPGEAPAADEEAKA